MAGMVSSTSTCSIRLRRSAFIAASPGRASVRCVLSNDQGLTRQVMVRHLEHTCVIEVVGELDLIGGYDLGRAFISALHGTAGTVTLDLSSVTALDDQGLASLEWCSARAVLAGRALLWVGCSQPFIRDLHNLLAA